MGNVSADGKWLWLSGRYGDIVYRFDTTLGAAAGSVFVGPHRESALSRLVLLVLAALVAGQAPAGEVEFRRPSDDAIRHKIIGKVVTDGAHWADAFAPDGAVQGHSLGRRYTGKWRIENGELCITRNARRPTEECFEVWASGTQIEYRRGGVPIAAGTLREAK